MDRETVELLERIIELEERRAREFRERGLGDTVFWELLDVPAEFHQVKKLIMAGLVERLGRRWYRLRSREEALSAVRTFREGVPSPPARAAPEPEIPEDLFAPVVGFEEIKDLLRTTLRSRKPTHVLLIGPPSSAKTLMLTEVARVPGAFYCLGGSTTKVGLVDQLFDLQPRYLLIDELEKMDRRDHVALLSLMETGIVKETKHERAREMALTTNVYAACNSTRGLPPELLSRFHFKLSLPEYSREEFERVAVATLTMREGVPEELARYIARRVTSGDIREAVGIARTASTPEEVDRLIAIKRKYKGALLSRRRHQL
jgi:Holliday junction DNA helicase RuvB